LFISLEPYNIAIYYIVVKVNDVIHNQLSFSECSFNVPFSC